MIWKLIAKFCAQPRVAAWLILRAMKTPYTHIVKDGEIYMERYWLFNPYPPAHDGRKRRWGDWLPSVRLHFIHLPDADRHCHDHPWDARTIILHGGYDEARLEPATFAQMLNTEAPCGVTQDGDFLAVNTYRRRRGDTAAIKFGEYHKITHIEEDGACTLFITWKYRGTWGFLVNGVKVPWRKYLGLERAAPGTPETTAAAGE